jgi:molybdopterin-guanine dinucleotide biosynthesis protein A
LDGFLLVGGESRRFGGPKHAAILAGRSFAEWGIRNLEAALGPEARIWLVAPPGFSLPDLFEHAGERVAQLDDAATARRGPLGGILAACRAGGGIVLAVDLPAVPVFALRRLGRDTTGVPQAFQIGGRVQPLAAFWPKEAEASCESVLRTSGRVRDAFFYAGGRVLDWRKEDPNRRSTWRFLNVNTPADREELVRFWEASEETSPENGGS